MEILLLIDLKISPLIYYYLNNITTNKLKTKNLFKKYLFGMNGAINLP